MRVYKTNRKVYWTNLLKGWLRFFVVITLLFYGLKPIFSFTQDELNFFFIVLLTLKVSDTLIHYHVIEIHIDVRKHELMFKLKSIISGEKIKVYELGQVNSEIASHTGVLKYLYSPFFLKIYLGPRDMFTITNQFGFTLDTITSFDKTLKLIKKQS